MDEDSIFERKTRRNRKREDNLQVARRRSLSHRRDRSRSELDIDIRSEADYYDRRAQDRSYVGEAYNGATRDWEIVDVPPGTERVKLNGVGGASQEITWQRYNGVRRSKFIPDGRGSRLRRQDLWTEITRDLVTREAIEQMGYPYDETEYFFYISEYLRYVSSVHLIISTTTS